MTIRPVARDDFPEWFNLRRALWPDAPESRLRREMEELFAAMPEARAAFIAWDGDCPAGFAECSIHTSAPGCVTGRIGYLEGWYVAPDLRRRGIGRALIRRGEAWAMEQGCGEMASDTTYDYPLSPAAHLGVGYRTAPESPLLFCKKLHPAPVRSTPDRR